jgi:hypothetical protein
MTFWGQDRHIKPSLLQLKDQIKGKKTIICKYKGILYDFFLNLAYLENIFVPHSLKTMRNNRTSPIMGKSTFFLQNLNIKA